MAEQLVIWATVVLLCVSAVMLWDILFQRRRQAQERSRQATLRAALLPVLSVYLAEEMTLETLLQGIGPDHDAIEPLLLQLLDSLEGAAENRLIMLAQVLGLVDRALRHIDSPDWTLRHSAALKLGLLGVESAVPSLAQRLRDPNSDVRSAAARSLGLIGTAAARAALVDALDRPELLDGARLLEIMQSMRGDLTPLHTVLHSEDYPLRSKLLAIDLVGDARDCSSVGVLHEILKSGDKEKVVRALKALGRIGHPGSIYQILGRVGHPDWEVRAQAVRAIGTLGIDEGIELLAGALDDQSYWVRRNAAEALLSFGTEGLAALESARSHRDEFAQDIAHYSLERVAA